MTLMKLINESAVQNVASWNPASLLRTITLPVYQILVTSTPTPHIDELPHCIRWRPSMSLGGGEAEVRGWRGERKTGLILETWKTGWIFLNCVVHLSRTVTGLSTLAMINGPTNLGPSLREGSLKLMSLEDNQTF